MNYNLKGKAYEYIKMKIVNCTYKPNSFLSESDLRQELDMSRTPIREALCLLEARGLISVLPKRGFIVNDIDINEVNMVYEERLRTEPYIITHYMQNINRATMEALLRQLKKGNESDEQIQNLSAMDNLLHQTICDSCPNIYIRDSLSHILDQTNRIRIIAGANIHERQRTSNNEHIQILEPILENDKETAAGAMQKHLVRSRDAAIRSLMMSDLKTETAFTF